MTGRRALISLARRVRPSTLAREAVEVVELQLPSENDESLDKGFHGMLIHSLKKGPRYSTEGYSIRWLSEVGTLGMPQWVKIVQIYLSHTYAEEKDV